MAEPSTADSSPDNDRDFDPTADMLVHDYDDEQTLQEEEQLSNSDASNELDELQKEGDMPIEELLAMYGYGGGGPIPRSAENQESRSSSEEEILSNQDLTLDKEEVARDLLPDDEDSNKETSANDLLQCVKIPSHTARLLRSANHEDESDDSEDADYRPIEDADWKKTIQVGSDFQAAIPEGMCKYGDAPAYENDDRLLWDPNEIAVNEVEGFLQKIQEQSLQSSHGVHAIPLGAHIRDDEQALFLLLQCGHNVEEALRRRKMQSVPPTDPMSLWSEEECRNFENGLKTYGKDFFLIQQNKVKTRSVGELVQFYYLWKKTERHDMFANKNRLEKKKYALHPGVTDYMERFLDEQETQSANKERPASPINSLLYGDQKRHPQPAAPDAAKPPTQEEIAAMVEMVQKVVDQNDLASKLTELAPELHTATPTITTPEAGERGRPGDVVDGEAALPPLVKPQGQLVVGSGDGEGRVDATGHSDSCGAEPRAKRQKLAVPDPPSATSTPQTNCVSPHKQRLEHSTNCVMTKTVASSLGKEQSCLGSKPMEDSGGKQTNAVTKSPVRAVAVNSLARKTVASEPKMISLGSDTSSNTNHRSIAAETMAH